MNKKQEEISEIILDYLRKNPDVGDTLEGITDWCPNFEDIERPVDDAANALECLIEKGIVGKKKNKDGTIIYYKICKKD